MKTDVEELSPTRVRLTVEVGFDELKPSLDRAYREVARQVRVPGFRPGRVPPRVIDQRVGRGPVLDQAVNDAVPQLVGRAVEENGLYALGQPELQITRLDDGEELAFTAEFEVRPKFDLPDLGALAVTVDDSEIGPDEVEEYLRGLRERFASLTGKDEPAAAGDYVSMSLSSTVDGEPVEDAQASGVSYEVGSGQMLDGLDEALTGMSAGETRTFTTQLAGGSMEGQSAEVTVTVDSVKVKELPEMDDEFAQGASEFDTVGELRAGTRVELEQMGRMAQAGQVRDKALQALIDQVDIPLPEGVVTAEVESRRTSLADRLERSGAGMEEYLRASNQTAEQFEEQLSADARRAIKSVFLLDQLASEQELTLDQQDLSRYVTEQAYRMGVPAEQLAKQLSDSGQLPSIAQEALRQKALTFLAEQATVTDESGRPVDISALAGQDGGDDDGGDSDEADGTDADPAE